MAKKSKQNWVRKTGPAPVLMQDDCAKLSKWFASKPDARWIVRQVCREIVTVRGMA